MNDYIAKPIVPEKLFAALCAVAAPPEPVSTQSLLAASDAVLDASVIANLESQIGADTVALLVDDFAASADDAIAQIAQARASGDLVVWTRAAHSLKSAAANMGLARVFQLADAIEAAGEKGDRSTMEARSGNLPDAAAAGVAALRARYAVAAGEETVNG